MPLIIAFRPKQPKPSGITLAFQAHLTPDVSYQQELFLFDVGLGLGFHEL